MFEAGKVFRPSIGGNNCTVCFKTCQPPQPKQELDRCWLMGQLVASIPLACNKTLWGLFYPSWHDKDVLQELE